MQRMLSHLWMCIKCHDLIRYIASIYVVVGGQGDSEIEIIAQPSSFFW